jgi:hypothetical protein
MMMMMIIRVLPCTCRLAVGHPDGLKDPDLNQQIFGTIWGSSNAEATTHAMYAYGTAGNP